MKRLALLVVILVATSALVAPAAAQSGEETTTVPTPENNTTTTAETTTTSTGGSSSTSGVAESVRVIPIRFDQSWLSTERVDRGEFNTSGPFAMFDVSDTVSSATIEESGARATVLGGGDVIKIAYSAENPAGKASLYTLRLNFDDGSTRTIDVYAHETNVDASASMMDKYQQVVLEQLNEAESEGYERSPEGLDNYYTALEEKAELLDHFLSEQASRAFATMIAWFSNPLSLVLTLLALAGGSYWLLNRHGRTLKILSGDSGKTARLRDRIALEHEETIRSAADEHLSDIEEVGVLGETYWQDAFGVSTTLELAELFRGGIPVRDREGAIHMVGGAENLDAGEIESSWLEPITREGRLPSPEIALSHARASVQRMMSRYGMTEHYQETYNQIRELQSELDAQGNEIRSGYTSSGNPFEDSSGAGGD